MINNCCEGDDDVELVVFQSKARSYSYSYNAIIGELLFGGILVQTSSAEVAMYELAVELAVPSHSACFFLALRDSLSFRPMLTLGTIAIRPNPEFHKSLQNSVGSGR